MPYPESCDLCPRLCGADRRTERGLCGGGGSISVSKTMLHHWEEPCICGDGAVGAVFFSGCALGCVYCQNSAISRPCSTAAAERHSPMTLALLFSKLERAGAVALDLVTPSHFAPQIDEALDMLLPSVPVIYNTGGYERPETVWRYMTRADVFLTDFKYGSSETAERYSSAPDYPETAAAALLEMYRLVGAASLSETGMLSRGIILRHLVLPGERRDSVRALRRVADTLPPGDVILSLMSQYTPGHAPAEYKNLSRRVTSFEYEYVRAAALEMGFSGYSQDRDSASAAYTPDFSEE